MSNIKQALSIFGGTKSAFARAVGVTPQMVDQWESGKRPISAKCGRIISEMTGVSWEKLCPDIFGPAPKPRRINTPEAVERALHVPRAVPEHAKDVEAEKQIEPVEPGELDMMEPSTDTMDYDPDIDRIGPLEEVA